MAVEVFQHGEFHAVDQRATSQRHDSYITATTTACHYGSATVETIRTLHGRLGPGHATNAETDPRHSGYAGEVAMNLNRVSEARTMHGLYKQERERLHFEYVYRKEQFKQKPGMIESSRNTSLEQGRNY